MALIVRATATGITQAMAWFDKVEGRLQNDRRKGLVRSLNRIGDFWLDSFDNEGSRVGGWPELAEFTVEKREELGYNGRNPILRRDGSLRNIMVVAMQKATGPQESASSDTYSGHTTRSALVLTEGTATIEAHGWKVSNQFKTSGRYSHPARPIWFVDKNVTFAAKSGIVDWLANDVLET